MSQNNGNSNDYIRKLARSSYWQTMFNNAKEIGSLKLFENQNDLSTVQIVFLRWLNIYNTLNTDLAMEEDYINEGVIKNDILCDAYLNYKSKKNKKDNNETKVDKYRFTEKQKFDGPIGVRFN